MFPMNTYRSVLSNLVFLLQGILILLLIFYKQLSVPEWLQVGGRFHPLILHFPIVLILLLPVIMLFKKSIADENVAENLFGFFLLHAAFFATVSALSGMFLSADGGYDEDLLQSHLISGSLTAILCFIAWLVYTYKLLNKSFLNVIILLNCGMLILGSHYGGSLTHGENYLAGDGPESGTTVKRIATDSSAIFEAAVQPILEAKCISCHNEKKAKGDLIMTDIEKMLQGGKDGPIWVAGDPLNSHIIKRILLDPSDKKHMPPKGKPQLTPDEIKFLQSWIAKGADIKKSFREYAVEDSFRVMAASFVQTGSDVIIDTTTYSFAAADEKILEKLVNPYRTITPRSSQSPALHAAFFVRQNYDPKLLSEIKPVKTQIVSINLSNMPVKDDALKELGTFENLEHLFLNGTDVDGSGFGELKKCIRLKTLSVANTKVTADKLDLLGTFPSLKRVYIWSSKVSVQEAEALQKKYPAIHWDRGFVPDSAEKLKLTPPQLGAKDKLVLNKGETISLRHPLPGVIVRYTVDGTDPDSINSPVYSKPLVINGPTTVKAISVLPGWYASGISEYQLFTGGPKPDEVKLQYVPDPKYSAQGPLSLIDKEKGEINNNLLNWLGFREKPFYALFTFNAPSTLNRVILSIADNHGGHLFPPEFINIKGGDDTTKLEQIGRLVPEQPKTYGPAKIKAYIVDIKPGQYKYIKIEAQNVQSLPSWHSGKKNKGWIFVDEVFFE